MDARLKEEAAIKNAFDTTDGGKIVFRSDRLQIILTHVPPLQSTPTSVCSLHPEEWFGNGGLMSMGGCVKS